MIAVHKYTIDRALYSVIETHVGAEFCALHVQDNQIRLWLQVNTLRPCQQRVYAIYATGQPIDTPQDLAFIGSVFLHDAVCVFHVYERV